MENKCQYIWKTTSKKGQTCGRRLLKSDCSYCYQHKSAYKKEPEKEPIVKKVEKPSKSSFIQLTNTQPTKKKTVVFLSESSTISSFSSSSSSSASSSDSD